MSKSPLKIGFIKSWGEGQDFGDEPLRLNQCSVIGNRKQFFESHIAVLYAGRDKQQKSIMRPFYERLVRFYNLVENEKAGN